MRPVILSALSAAAAIISSSNPASAAPSSGAAVLDNAVATRFEAVQSSRRWWLPYRYYGGPTYSLSGTYCVRRYRSYDAVTGTYLGPDGLRHFCP